MIDAKIAISKDNFTINKKSKWISNYRSRKVAHLIRSKYDCILSTSKSINKDNSLLNCRIEGFNYFKPELIIIDNHLSLKTDLKLISLAKKRKTYIFTASNNKKKINFFKRKNIKVLKFDELLTKKDFNFFFKKIYSLGKTRILVESGLTFLNKLLYYNLLNNLYIFKSNLNLKKKGSNNAKIDFIKNLKPNEKINVNLQNDKLFKVRIK